MGTDEADDCRGQLDVEILGSAGDAELGGESVIVAVFELLRHNVHPNLICLDQRDSEQYRAVAQDW
jgi:hypothetical protein